jgi:hypothetical protein
MRRKSRIGANFEAQMTIKATQHTCQVAYLNQPNNHHTSPILTLPPIYGISIAVQCREKIPSPNFKEAPNPNPKTLAKIF